MPLVSITLQKGTTAAFRKSVLENVHASLVAHFKIPDSDRNQRIIEIEPENIEIPAGKTSKFMTIECTVFPGRSPEAKRNLYKDIVVRLVALGVAESDILIILNEPPLMNWGIRGGYPASEVDIGFKINV